MKKKAVALIIIALTSMLFISGCTQTTSIRSQEEVGQAVTNVSTDIEDVSSTLDSIDKTLGGTK